MYLGWSGSDPYFKLVFGELLSRFGQMMRSGYAVMFDVTDDQRDELRRKQIRLVELPAGDRTAQLAVYLGTLAPPGAMPAASTPAMPASGVVGAKLSPEVAETGGIRPDRPEPRWNTEALRELLTAAFSDEELTTLCFDTFRTIYEDFATGMSKKQKIQLLLDYCIRHEQVEELLAAVRKANPAQYDKRASGLRTG